MQCIAGTERKRPVGLFSVENGMTLGGGDFSFVLARLL